MGNVLPLFTALFLFASLFLYSQQEKYVPGELLLQIREGVKVQTVEEFFSHIELSQKQLLSKRMNIWLFTYNNNLIEDDDVLYEVRQNKDIKIVQFNHHVSLRKALPIFSKDGARNESILVTMPNDTRFNEQWALHNTGQSGGTPDADIDAPEAWDYSTGGLTALGDTIVIAIIDGGFDLNHQDLKYWKNYAEIPSNGIDDDGNGYIDDYHGWNAYNNNGNITSNTHGTHVAGISGAKGNNGLGVSGVNWTTQIMPVQGSSGNEATVVIAYSYVLEMRARYNETNGLQGAFVVSTNASFGVDYGQPANFPLWCAIYDSLGVQGVLSCGATANLNINIDLTGDIPTACPSEYMIAVTNTTRNDIKNTGAAYGLTTIDLGAPGTSILSTTPGGNYSNLTGTSMATPTVAGAIGLIFAAANSDLITIYKNDYSAGAIMFRDYLLEAVDTLSSLIGKTVTGGRLNLFNAVLAVTQNIPVELSSFTCISEGNSMLVSWSTATETNNSGFSLERKSSSDDWKQIVFIKGKGSTTTTSFYSYKDSELQAGRYFYRLKQVDMDGSFTYSDEIESVIDAPADFVLMQNYPNPFNPSTRIKFSLPASSSAAGWKVSLMLYDVLGNEVAEILNEQRSAGTHEVEVNSGNLASGVYVYRMCINENNFSTVQRMIVLK